MVAAGGQAEPDRLDPAKLSAFPSQIDIDTDILIPQYIDKWQATVWVALRTRYLTEVIEHPEDPSLQSFVEEYEPQGLSTEEITTFYETTMEKRHDKKQAAATALHGLIKDEALTQDQRRDTL